MPCISTRLCSGGACGKELLACALPDLAPRDSAYGTVFPMMLDLGLSSRGGTEQCADQTKAVKGILLSSIDHEFKRLWVILTDACHTKAAIRGLGSAR